MSEDIGFSNLTDGVESDLVEEEVEVTDTTILEGGDNDGFKITQDSSPVNESSQRIAFKIWNGKKVPFPARWSLNSTINNIMNHNMNSQYTGILLCGASGSGKTTLFNTMIHKLIERDPTYIVKRFTGEDFSNLDVIINKLEIGRNHIIVFDDASYVTDDIDNKTLKKLAYTLTIIRHKVKARVISFMVVHYSKAMFKFFRAVPFVIYTSINAEELGNYMDLYHQHTFVVRKFASMYRQMTLRGWFQTSINNYNGTQISYAIDKPFRIAMIEEAADLHYILYYKESCERCNETYVPRTEDMSKMADELFERWGKSAVYATRWYGFAKGAKVSVRPEFKAIIKFLTLLNTQVPVDYELLCELLDKKMNYKYHRKTLKAANSKTISASRVAAKNVIDSIKNHDPDVSPAPFIVPDPVSPDVKNFINSNNTS